LPDRFRLQVETVNFPGARQGIPFHRVHPVDYALFAPGGTYPAPTPTPVPTPTPAPRRLPRDAYSRPKSHALDHRIHGPDRECGPHPHHKGRMGRSGSSRAAQSVGLPPPRVHRIPDSGGQRTKGHHHGSGWGPLVHRQKRQQDRAADHLRRVREYAITTARSSPYGIHHGSDGASGSPNTESADRSG